jgi:hypothetical protein
VRHSWRSCCSGRRISCERDSAWPLGEVTRRAQVGQALTSRGPRASVPPIS